MAYTTIDKPTDYFETVTYTGDTSSGTTISSLDFAPNMVWFKSRTNAENHQIYDSVRGVTKRIIPNGTQAEATASTGLTNFDSNGFRTGGENETDSGNIVAWNWKETATAGFDIVSYTGNSSVRTISHNCGAIPKMMIVKKRSDSDNWSVYHQATGAGNFTILNTTAASAGSSTMWNNTTPTASVFSLGNKGEVNANGETFIAYLFADIKGYSKFGSYVGNGNVDGTFFYTGFKPAFTIIKSTGSDQWSMFDAKRNPFNEVDNNIRANSSAAEADQANKEVDYLSNGVKLRTSSGEWNTSGTTYIYMAFAESPLVTSTGVPTTAR